MPMGAATRSNCQHLSHAPESDRISSNCEKKIVVQDHSIYHLGLTAKFGWQGRVVGGVFRNFKLHKV